MKKLLILGLACLLGACVCKTHQRTVAPTQTMSETAASENTASVNVKSSAKVAKAESAVTDASTEEHSAVSQTACAAAVPAILAQAEPQEPAFTSQQAAELIDQDRANQTLSEVPADTPVFKKEEILPTQNRLLHPLAYEPLLPDNTQAPWSNESLKYGIYYSFIKAGTAYIKTRGLVNKNGKSAYLIQTTAFSASVIDSVFRVRDINYSWIDANTFYSLGYAQSLREGNYVRDEWLSFDPANNRFYGEIKKKEESYVIAGELDQEVLDILSSLYFVRSQPLEVGKDLVFDIVNREKKYPLLVKVLGKETVKTAAGKFNCWLVEPQLRGEGIFVVKGKSLKVWLSDDPYRMPVKMSVEVFIGSVSAELLEYKRN